MLLNKTLCRKVLVLTFSLSGFVLLKAQQDFDLELQSNGGGEYNVFRSSGLSSGKEPDVESGKLRHGYFQSFNYSSRYKLKLNDHQLSLSAYSFFKFFPAVKEARQFRPRAGILYRYIAGEKIRFYVSAQFKSYNNIRIDEQEDEQFRQSSFRKYSMYFKKSLELNASMDMQVLIKYARNNFTSSSNTEQHYDSKAAELRIYQTLYDTRKYQHKIKLELEYEDRRYYLRELTEADRHRIYRSLGMFYYIKRKKRYQIDLGLQLEERSALNTSRFSYRQVRAVAKYELKKKKIQYNFSSSFSYRDYSKLIVDKSLNESLHLYSLNNSIDIEYSLKKDLKLLLEARYVFRKRNSKDAPSFLLPYTNARISIGFRFDIF